MDSIVAVASASLKGNQIRENDKIKCESFLPLLSSLLSLLGFI